MEKDSRKNGRKLMTGGEWQLRTCNEASRDIRDKPLESGIRVNESG